MLMHSLEVVICIIMTVPTIFRTIVSYQTLSFIAALMLILILQETPLLTLIIHYKTAVL